jgi:hypothetical protein
VDHQKTLSEEPNMSRSARTNRFRACLLGASLIFAPIACADIFAPTPAVPPANSVYNLQNTCILVVCLENITLSGFDVLSSNISGGNELTVSDVTLSASGYQDVGGSPGAFIAPVLLNGPVDITYFDKHSLLNIGTFNDQITFLDLTGSFNGHSLTAMLNPAHPSTGQTTITAAPAGSVNKDFKINSFFDVFTELSIDHGPFVPGPGRVANLTPEPAYYGALGILLAGMVVARRLF